MPDWDDGESRSGLTQRLLRTIPNWQCCENEDLQHVDLQGGEKGSQPVQQAFAGLIPVSYWASFLFRPHWG